MFSDFRKDYYRYTGQSKIKLSLLMRDHSLRYLFFLRAGVLFWPFRKHLQTKYGLELGCGNNIEPGLYLGHAYGITVNPRARIGKNCNLHKGCTIGQENRGKRAGCPTLGERVWVGAHSTIVGNVTVGDDVLIAPNTYVNRNIPSHSIVIGSPCRIMNKINATDSYVGNLL